MLAAASTPPASPSRAFGVSAVRRHDIGSSARPEAASAKLEALLARRVAASRGPIADDGDAVADDPDVVGATTARVPGAAWLLLLLCVVGAALRFAQLATLSRGSGGSATSAVAPPGAVASAPSAAAVLTAPALAPLRGGNGTCPLALAAPAVTGGDAARALLAAARPAPPPRLPAASASAPPGSLAPGSPPASTLRLVGRALKWSAAAPSGALSVGLIDGGASTALLVAAVFPRAPGAPRLHALTSRLCVAVLPDLPLRSDGLDAAHACLSPARTAAYFAAAHAAAGSSADGPAAPGGSGGGGGGGGAAELLLAAPPAFTLDGLAPGAAYRVQAAVVDARGHAHVAGGTLVGLPGAHPHAGWVPVGVPEGWGPGGATPTPAAAAGRRAHKAPLPPRDDGAGAGRQPGVPRLLIEWEAGAPV